MSCLWCPTGLCDITPYLMSCLWCLIGPLYLMFVYKPERSLSCPIIPDFLPMMSDRSSSLSHLAWCLSAIPDRSLSSQVLSPYLMSVCVYLTNTSLYNAMIGSLTCVFHTYFCCNAQDFVVRNDSPCGSTIGPIMSAKLGMQTIDVGAPQLSMHSIREMGDTTSIVHCTDLFRVCVDLRRYVLTNVL